MNRLMWAIHAVVATTLMGVGVTAVLAAGMPGWRPIALAAVVGFVSAFPVSYVVANKMEHLAR